MGRQPSHPDAEGIADDSRDEYGEDQLTDAKIAIEVHRLSTAAASRLPHTGRATLRAIALLLLLVLDVTYDGFAYVGDKVIERPVFFLARVEFVFQFGVVVLVRFPQRGLVYFRDCHFISLPPNGPYWVGNRSVVSLPHFVH
jgi:hypothetical protein